MNPSNKYKYELNSYTSYRGEEECDLCAGHLYGKFLNYVDSDDYVGASLTKRFLIRGDWHCSQNGYKNNKFISFYRQADENSKFKEIKTNFFHDGVGQKERETEAAFS